VCTDQRPKASVSWTGSKDSNVHYSSMGKASWNHSSLYIKKILDLPEWSSDDMMRQLGQMEAGVRPLIDIVRII